MFVRVSLGPLGGTHISTAMPGGAKAMAILVGSFHFLLISGTFRFTNPFIIRTAGLSVSKAAF